MAGGRGNVRFTTGAFKKIYMYSHGNPRRINAVCDRALLIAYAKEAYIISKKIVRKAIEDFRDSMTVDPSVLGWSRRRFESATIILLLLALLVIVVIVGGWKFKGYFQNLLAGKQSVALVTPRYEAAVPPRPKEKPKAAALVLDEKTSLAGLFDRSNIELKSDDHLGLFSFDLTPEYYVMLKKPFRIHLADSFAPSANSPRYLLIHKVEGEGAIAVNAEGKAQEIPREFILGHWNRKVSWVYPYKGRDKHLMKGMNIPAVSEVQKALNAIGYRVAPTGVYDESMSHGIEKFQEDFGLVPDGVIGLRTRALLYQMVD